MGKGKMAQWGGGCVIQSALGGELGKNWGGIVAKQTDGFQETQNAVALKVEERAGILALERETEGLQSPSFAS